MSNLSFYIVDVFAERKYAGNQLAVFRNAGSLSTDEMQQIALEMNYSETTFITSEEPADGGYDVRIFTPKTELPFAGHPTLGTAFIIQREIIKKPVETVTLNLKVGQIPVTIGYKDGAADTLWMRQVPPEFGAVHDKEAFAAMLGIDRSDISDEFPIEEVSTGFYSYIVPLKTLDAVRRVRVLLDEFYRYTESTVSKVVLVFAPETREPGNDLTVRFFGHALGVPEDPATGSANGCLAGYLVKNRYFGSDSIDVRVEQGHEIDRPSLLMLRAHKDTGGIEVNVGGSAILTAAGDFV